MALHVVDQGRSSLAIVFIHGFPLTHAAWRDQADLLRPIARTLLYDQAGFGESPGHPFPATFESYVDDLEHLLRDREVPRAVLCGLSMGGYVALRATERFPERVAGLVLCDTRSEADSDEAKLKRHAGILKIEKDGLSSYLDGFEQSVLGPTTLQTRPDVRRRARALMDRNPPASLQRALAAMASRTDTTASLAAIRVPALLLVGEEDSVTPVAAARAMHERISGSRLETIPRAGHFSNLENPDAFNQALRSFVAGLS